MKKDNTRKPKIHHIKTIAQSQLFTIESVDIEFNNGKRRIYERMQPSNSEAVLIVPIIDQHILLVREYGVAIDNYEIGFPKGLVDSGENIMEAANRELMEEAGFGSKALIFLSQLTIMPSYFSGKMNIIMAKDLYPKRLQGDEPEPLTVIKWPISKMLSLLNEPNFCEARNVSALFLAYSNLYQLLK
ncbi:ADP compounds hydrolase NudE [Candidatus Schneideria nysicola]|uniref:ADP compounds hydrolase NudE n=1 Tax=Candidatus Schneideria nysicola TaxID=1081631 RepID=UPI001CAA601B|nr:ADP compounds hydrolase NudE [Candidatus Schneideria nysicola]UAJ65325.1 ADP compounds hydrolase NudE [Candidatus Schneideria nysicola]